MTRLNSTTPLSGIIESFEAEPAGTDVYLPARPSPDAVTTASTEPLPQSTAITVAEPDPGASIAECGASIA
jgi:hypothetical protein